MTRRKARGKEEESFCFSVIIVSLVLHYLCIRLDYDAGVYGSVADLGF